MPITLARTTGLVDRLVGSVHCPVGTVHGRVGPVHERIGPVHRKVDAPDGIGLYFQVWIAETARRVGCWYRFRVLHE